MPLSAVTLADPFRAPRLRALCEVTLPSQHRLLEETGRLDNLRRAAGKMEGSFQGWFFNDSDVYKWLEAVAWTLAWPAEATPGARATLAPLAEAVIAEVAAAQQPDGYLDSYLSGERAAERWTNLRDLVLPHEESLTARDDPGLLGGVVTLHGQARAVPPEPAWDGCLYRTAGPRPAAGPGEAVSLTAIPYYARANRKPGAMQVWIRSDG